MSFLYLFFLTKFLRLKAFDLVLGLALILELDYDLKYLVANTLEGHSRYDVCFQSTKKSIEEMQSRTKIDKSFPKHK